MTPAVSHGRRVVGKGAGGGDTPTPPGVPWRMDLSRRVVGGRGRTAVGRTGVRGLVAAMLVGGGALVGIGGGPTAGAAMGASATGQTEYYLALGDSLAAGVGADSGKGYVDDIYAKEQKRHSGLVLKNLSCSGATTSSMINGPGCSYRTGTQLGDAEAFLKKHSRHVTFVTIDIGANDVDECVSGSGIDMTCFDNGISAITSNLPLILSGLASAGGSAPVVGMTYYDPFLAAWVLIPGSSGQSIAQESLTLADQLNSLLSGDFGSGHTADVVGAFDTADFALKAKYQGTTVPVNVARICRWTHMCTTVDFHADDAGHAKIAKAFEKVVGPLVSAGRSGRP